MIHLDLDGTIESVAIVKFIIYHGDEISFYFPAT